MFSRNVDYSDCSTARATIQRQYDKLNCLSVNNLLPSLFTNGVVTFKQKQEIESIPQEMKRMEFILDLVIKSLSNDVPVLYNGFLKVLKESEDLVTKELATKLGKLIHLHHIASTKLWW